MENTNRARIHRFRDSVALYTPGSETVYLSADMAEQLAEQLATYADNVRSTRFSESSIGTATVTVEIDSDA